MVVANGAMSEGAVLNVNTGEGDDTVSVAVQALSDGSVLNVDLGSGSDSLVINGQTGLSAGGVATINVTCGAGADVIALDNATAGKLIVQVSNFTAGVDAIDGGSFNPVTSTGVGAASANALAQSVSSVFGINVATGGEMVSIDGVVRAGYAVNGNIYMVDGSSPSAWKNLIVLQGVSPEEGGAFDLDGNGLANG